MKRIWVALTLLLICFSIGIIEYSVVNANQQRITQILDSAQTYISNREYKKGHNVCKYALVQWENEKKTLNTFLVHGDVETVSDNISLLCLYAQNKDAKNFSLVLDTTKRQLLCLKESELPLFENIL